MDHELLIQQKRSRDAKRFFFVWLRRLVVAYVLIIALYILYLVFVRNLTLVYYGNVQKDYAKYMVEQNDLFVDYMLEFENLTSQTKTVYSDETKNKIKNALEKQNKFLSEMQKRAPDASNSDYLDLYQDTLQIYAFYIQGEVMKAEYCFSYSDEYIVESEYADATAREETYTIGNELCNMMGNMILNNFTYINQIRGTSYPSKHNIVPMSN